MDVAAKVLIDVFVMFLAAKVAGAVFERVGQPAVIGEILAGIALGPHALGWIGLPNEAIRSAFHSVEAAASVLETVYDVLAELGVIVLLFAVGLETRLSSILRVGGRAGFVAVAGVIAPFVLGFGFITLLGSPTVEALFVATAMVATSVGITARVLADLGQVQTDEARIILGAAVIDDVLGMIVLAVVSAIGQTGTVSVGTVALIGAQALGFTAVVALAGRHAVQRWSVHLERLPLRDAAFVVAVLLMLGLAALAAMVGLAAIIGAFLAGMALAELDEQYALEQKFLPIYDLLVPLFFVITGSHVDWRLAFDSQTVLIALTVTALAVVGKLGGCGLGGWGMGWRTAAILGVGMVPRGEVGLIVANAGRSLGVIPEDIFSSVIVMTVLTTLVAPPVLTLLYGGQSSLRRHGPTEDDVDFAIQDGRLPDL